MAFSTINMATPFIRSLLANRSCPSLRSASISCFSTPSSSLNGRTLMTGATKVQAIRAGPLANRLAIQPLHTTSIRHDSATVGRAGSFDEQPLSIAEILEREIQDESVELSQHLSTDQFPGFSVETDGSDVKLIKQVGNDTNVTVRFTVSSSLNEWPAEVPQGEGQQQKQQGQEGEGVGTTLMSMPEFQVQISKNDSTLELSCYFEEMEQDEETGEPFACDPVFGIDELVMYQGEPKETEFAVSAEYFQDDLQAALLQYLAQHGINDEFAKNLVGFATSYEKKQYVGLMKRLKDFVSK